jgi:hypothetical protein
MSKQKNGHCGQLTPTLSGVIDGMNSSLKSSPALLFQRRGSKSSPFEKGGSRGIFFDQFDPYYEEKSIRSVQVESLQSAAIFIYNRGE